MQSANQQALLEIAITAARAGARELRARFGSAALGVRTKSSATDPVSEADVTSERAVRAVLERHRPSDGILAEEGGNRGPTVEDGLRWIVDPLDGTVNFLFGVPLFAVSVACEDAHGTLAGVVLDPLREECFAATRDGPATLNGEQINGSSRSDLAQALVATGFAYDARTRARQAAVVARVLPAARDIRRGGAAALDLVWCACGRFDAYYERDVKHWDIAAGALIASRAGLVVRRLEARGEDPQGLVVAPPGLIDALCELVER